MRLGSLCSGTGMLDRAVEILFGVTTAWHCENDKAASAVLAAHWPGVENFGDITAVDWTTVEPVDIIAAGFPCQDVSAAGKRSGLKDGNRSGLWVYCAEAIDALRPSLVVIENVRGLCSARAHRAVESRNAALGDGSDGPVLLRALGAVLGDLSDIGYDAQWITLPASAVGAPHRRERVFIIAAPTDTDSGRTPRQLDTGAVRRMEEADSRRGPGSQRGAGGLAADRGDEDAADTARQRWKERLAQPAWLERGSDAAVGDPAAGLTLLSTPRVTSQRTSRKALTAQQWSRPSIEQQLEIARGELPREYESWDEIRGDQDAPLLPTPVATDAFGSARHTTTTGVMHPGTSLTDAIRLLPTPCAHPSGNTPENHLEKKPGRQVVTDLAVLVENGLLQTGGLLPTPTSRDHKGRNQRDDPSCLPGALLPTPNANDGNGGRTSHPDDRRAGGHQLNLNEVARHLLPTPSVADAAGGHTSRSGERKGELLLGGVVKELEGPLLPTPSASDGIGGGPNKPESRAEVKDTKAGTWAHHVQLIDLGIADRETWGRYAEAIARWEAVVGPAPAPTEPNRSGNPRLNPAFSEWMMGWPSGWVTAVDGISRNDKLRIIGNGVCPQQAMFAFQRLLS